MRYEVTVIKQYQIQEI